MGSKMLMDAAHPEETRVVVVRGNRVEDFDYESASRKQLRGNIYLAKVTRVEPSLQAAFVDYGGNRHGFLAFSEIHPDYYQIPVADRKALLEEEAEEESRALAEEAADDEGGSRRGRRGSRRRRKADEAASDDPADGAEALEAAGVAESVSEDPASEAGGDADDVDETAPPVDAATDVDEEDEERAGAAAEGAVNGNGGEVESVGSEDALEELPVRSRRRRRIYKIQEVIKRRQIILVQVVKEERGNKGAALTTYLSLAGRYTVLMPNTARGGGISRKITNPTDRKRLRKIASELEVPGGMGLIIRTAGAARTKTEIKRDFEYLLRMWENIRDLTLKSTAPALVYEEGNLIKRAIRDLYDKEVDEILVSGEEAHKEAKAFMRMLMPSHAKNVKLYKEPEPIFVHHRIERQLSAMFSPYVTLRSGGYIVLNQTEALVSIDVNSGKATREHSIEETALKTNLEAAEEIARQLRLRDLAGLIVIDFIDMDERRNNRAVERRIKECLRSDRARIQVGRISHFGLLEMSRQRLRTGMLEGTTSMCTMCHGTGIVRSTESVALDVLRSLEDTLLTEKVTDLVAITPVGVALYILNQKRETLKDIELRYGISIAIDADPQFHGASFTIEHRAAAAEAGEESAVIQIDSVFQTPEEEEAEAEAESEQGQRRGRRRRRRRGRGRGEREPAEADGEAYETLEAEEEREADEEEAAPSGRGDGNGKEETGRRARRRGRRGGRRARAAARGGEAEPDSPPAADEAASQQPESDMAEAEEEPAPARGRTKRAPARARKSAATASQEAAEEPSAREGEPPSPDAAAETAAAPETLAGQEGNGQGDWPAADEAAPKAEKKRSKVRDAAPPAEAEAGASEGGTTQADESGGEPRRGWWQRRA